MLSVDVFYMGPLWFFSFDTYPRNFSDSGYGFTLGKSNNKKKYLCLVIVKASAQNKVLGTVQVEEEDLCYTELPTKD